MLTLTKGSSAGISLCGRYRYWLIRRWSDAPNRVVWFMLNPSTADKRVDDPTIRKCIGFTKRWSTDRIEYGGIAVVNLFAFRATSPSQLAVAEDPFGPHNETWQNAFVSACGPHDLVIAAWGAHGKFLGAGSRVRGRLNGRAMCLGRTSAGEPRHPLMIPYSCALEVYK